MNSVAPRSDATPARTLSLGVARRYGIYLFLVAQIGRAHV